MKSAAPTPVSFSHHKYGQPLAVDASSFPRWTGIVPDGEPHVLDFHEFLVVSDGAAEVAIGDCAVTVTGPTVIFTPPSIVRRVEVIDPLQLQLVVFSSEALRRSGCSPLKRMNPGPQPIHDRAALQSLTGLAQLMAAELTMPRPDTSVMLDALLSQFLVTLNRATGAPAAMVPPLLARFERLLELRIRQDHDVSAYAAMLDVTPDHLSAVVRSHHGLSAKTLIDRRLFSEAAQLLTSTTWSIAAIGTSLGFDEPSHFSRFFTRACGQAPSRFRAR